MTQQNWIKLDEGGAGPGSNYSSLEERVFKIP